MSVESERLNPPSPPSSVEVLLRQSPFGIACLSLPDRRYVWLNAAMARINNRPIEETLGCTPEQVIGPEAVGRIGPVIAGALQGGKTYGEAEITANITALQGDQRRLFFRCHVARDDSGTAKALWVVIQDVTVERRLEAEHRDQEARLQALMEAVPTGILLSDSEGHLIFANREAERIWGHPLIETGIAGYAQYGILSLAGERIEPEETALAQALQPGAGRITTTRLICRPDGTTVPTISTGVPIINEAGVTTGAVVSFQDITELRRLERRQHRLMEIAQAVNANDELSHVLRLVRDAVVEAGPFDRAGLWLHDPVRDGMCGTWGTGRDGNAFDESGEFFPLSLDGDHPLQSVLRGERRYILSEKYSFAQQPSTAVSMEDVGAHATLALRAHGRVIGMLFVDNLLSGRPIAEKDLLDLMPFCEQAAVAIESARLRQADRKQTKDLRDAVRVTNHRVKNNLQIILAILDTQLLDSEEPLDRGAFVRVKRQIRALSAVHDFLGDTSPELDAKIGDILESLLSFIGDRVECRLEADDAVIEVKQATAVALILDELVENATRHGAKSLAVQFRSTSSEDRARYRLEVTDDGPGFPDDFSPLRSLKRGLSYASTLACWDLRGSITCRNVETGGAQVVVEF